MTARIPDAEDRETALIRLIEARTAAIERDIRAGRTLTTKPIFDALQRLSHGSLKSRAQLWAALTMGVGAVGPRLDAAVRGVIFLYAEHLAEADVAEMERARTESANDDRIDRAEWARAVN